MQKDVEMFTKVVNNNIHVGCLSFKAEEYGERIVEIGWKLRTL